MPKQLIMRILGAAIVLIALSFAPSVAQAHLGHQHQASLHNGQGHAALQAESRETERAATPASLQQSQWNQTGTLPASDRNCTGGCRLLCGRIALSGDVHPVSPVDDARGICAVTAMAGPRA